MASLLPLNPKTSSSNNETGVGNGTVVWYGGTDNDINIENKEEDEEMKQLLVVGYPNYIPSSIEYSVADVLVHLFVEGGHPQTPDIQYAWHHHPKSHPRKKPVKRFLRHRNYYIYNLNQFRHWWKTSRLLVRLSGGYEYCLNPINWSTMATYTVTPPTKHHLHIHRNSKNIKHALKSMKSIGRGGVSRDFLKNVQKYTRTIRIVLAVARALEARVDNRMYEVGVAEAMAFMGNRCSRWVARTLAYDITKYIALPLSVEFLAPYLDQNNRPVIVTMGFIRAVLPFLFSFTGSAIGRKLTFNTFQYANHRWRPVQSIMKFHQHQGVYEDTHLDPQLIEIGRTVATAIGHGAKPAETRDNLAQRGFKMVGAGNGGYAVYEQHIVVEESRSVIVITLHVTPYGPAILGEMPRYIVLERRRVQYRKTDGMKGSDATILNAAQPTEAAIYGFTYSGAFFKNQEWAALTARYQVEMESYKKACRRMGTARALENGQWIEGAPSDLPSLKDFIKSGHEQKRMRKEKRRLKQIDAELARVTKLLSKYQKAGTAPKRVILYLEGLDCSGKSSTANLVCKALEQGGFEVHTAQHNRPPTPEQQALPWMNRSRFEYPEDVILKERTENMDKDEKDEHSDTLPEHAALVWDRGPAGDFVYGKLDELTMTEKMIKHKEFRTYDAQCHKDGVLFCKLLFVTNKDSIASTLGKRLAHKKIARELRTWLDANWVEQGAMSLEGLEAIELHIDPTDFVAFNKYEENLAKFTEFARNTDTIGNGHGGKSHYENPWTVVNTSKRHPARLGLMREFRNQLTRFSNSPPTKHFEEEDDDPELRPMISNTYVEDREAGISFRAVFQSLLLLMLVYWYGYITWKFDILRGEYI